jgi:hypothetical protein
MPPETEEDREVLWPEPESNKTPDSSATEINGKVYGQEQSAHLQ